MYIFLVKDVHLLAKISFVLRNHPKSADYAISFLPLYFAAKKEHLQKPVLK